MPSSLFARTVKQPFQRLRNGLVNNLNFYRTHLLFFTFTPLIFSGIFYASNGRYKVSYVDSLFNCVSAMTVCGLATVNLSSLTHFQQVLLFFQMCIGNPVIVSWVIVYMRRYFFAKKFEGILEAAAMKKAASIVGQAQAEHKPWPHRLLAFVSGRQLSVVDEENAKVKKYHGGAFGKLRPEMIRRMDDAPKLVNPSGWVSEDRPAPVKVMPITNIHLSKLSSPSHDEVINSSQATTPNSRPRSASVEIGDTNRRRRRLSDPGTPSRPTSPKSTKMQRYETVTNAPASPVGSIKRFPRTQTIEFAPDPMRHRGRFRHSGVPEPLQEEPHSSGMLSPPGRNLYTSPSIPISTRTHTSYTHPSHRDIPPTSMTTDYGGFPSPFAVVRSLLESLFPRIKRTFSRTVTMPATISLSPSHAGTQNGSKKHAPYISFEAVVGRNSTFHLLTKEQMEELGGVEYRALNALLWIVAAYHIMVQLLAFTVIAPYISTKKYKPVFDVQIRPFSPVWFAAFQVVSAYTNTGTSLVDESMVPFQKAYPMIFAMIVLILAGNTSFPIFLRFMIWCISKMVPPNSRRHETLHFLLDHPRRCFIYLFPSHQTWFLLTVVLGLTITDWFFFLVLDLSTPAITSIPVGIRFLDGLFQAIAVRAAGFGIVSLSSLAPAVMVLYVVMMYISVYPIAMSVRSTNVYEERSLGLFHPEDHDGEEEDYFEPSGSRMTVWSRYLAMHARKQLAFDMWWLGFSLFLICIIERNNLENPSNYGWFTIFRIVFELVSAYGTVGLSLGIPNQNYSFSGALHPLSKLIVCVVMLRGRHRGLPVAIDRAIMLPSEFKNDDPNPDDIRLGDEGPGSPFHESETMNSRTLSGIRQRSRPSNPSASLANEFGIDKPEEHTISWRESDAQENQNGIEHS